jgi:hypothetical protein
MAIRDFTSEQDEPGHRSIDDDAPAGLRQEIIDAALHVLEMDPDYSEQRLHRIICQSLGLAPSAEPYGGFRYAIGRDVRKADWKRVYDLICRLFAEVPWDLKDKYRVSVNRVLTAYHVAWDLAQNGQLVRVVPIAVASQIETTFNELNEARYSPACSLFRDGMAAYNDRPQRGRETCANLFDALESVGKIAFGMPAATFGDVLKEARRRQAMSIETIALLQKLYDMANNHFRHGMSTPFILKAPEVDFVLVSCLAGILLLVRL